MNLLPYQARWVQDDTGLAVIQKSRRVGISWAEAYGSLMHAAEGRGNTYYQSYSLDMARTFIGDVEDWARHLDVALEAVGESLLDVGDRHAVQAFSVTTRAGRRVTALASSPRVWRSRGKPGDRAVIDEAAFVDDLDSVLTAALATRVWGGTVRIVSTHRGEASPFAALCRDVAEGVQPGSLHRVTLRDALADGLYRRICDVTGTAWSPAREAEWEVGLRAEYGYRAAEELDCVPAAGSGAWLPWETIRAAEHADAGRPELGGTGPAYIGVDVARRRDLWVAVVVEVAAGLLWLRQLEARQGITFAAQRAIVAALAQRWRPVRIAVDQTGMGEGLVEQLASDHGQLRVEGVLMTAPRRLDVATALREAAEDRRLRIPSDEALRRDLYAIRAEDHGPTGAPRLVAERSDTDGHADRFWALALAVASASAGAGEISYQPVRSADRLAELPDDDDRRIGDRPSPPPARAWHGAGLL